MPPGASYCAPRPKQYKTAQEYLSALGGIPLERVLQVQPALVEAVREVGDYQTGKRESFPYNELQAALAAVKEAEGGK